MPISSALHCPDCNAEITTDARACAECGADLGLWPESQRTPLILPGNPALSADVVRKRTSVPKIAGGAVLTSVFVGAVLYFMPERQIEEQPRLVAVAGPRMATDDADAPLPGDLRSAAARPSQPPKAESLAAYSYGDSALTRAVPTAARRVAPPAVSRPVAVSSVRGTPTRTSSAPSVRTPAAPRVTAVPRATAPANAMLRMLPLVSTTLRPGERLQLRWSVTDRRSRRAVPARLEFTSTDASIMSVGPRDGVVIARAPGTASIIVDGGAAGQTTVRLNVRAPASSQVVTVAPAPAIQPPRVTSSTPIATATTASPAPPPVTAPVTAPVSAPVTAPVREMPDAGDVRSVVDRFIRDVRSGSVKNFDLMQFLADGADHRVTLASGPTTTGSTAYNIRVTFQMRLAKYDGGGRPVTRLALVSMDVDKRDSQATSSAIAIGALQRP